MPSSTIKIKQYSKNHIHDKFFREFFSCLKYAREFLLKWLPDDIKQDTDFDTLTLVQNDFNPTLMGSDEFIADLIFSAEKFRKNLKTSTKNYFIIEHKSYYDKLAPFQLYLYQNALWLRLLRNSKFKKLPLKKLPMVYVILVHQAKKPLIKKPDIKNLIDAPVDLIENYFLKSPIVIDIAASQGDLNCAESWMRDYHKPNPLELFKRTAAELMQMRLISWQSYYIVVDYILRTQSAEIIEQIKLYLQSHEEEIMRAARKDFVSCADELIESGWRKGHQQGIEKGIEQGIEKGIEKGIEQGIQKGRCEAMLEMAKALIRQGSSNELILQVTGLSEQDIAAFC